MKLLRKLRALFRRDRLEAEMAEEMRAHVELQTERNLATGMEPDEARYAALRQFGNVASVQEQAREGRGLGWLHATAGDARFALRSLRRAPGFALVAVMILTLGVAASTAIYSIVHALLLSPLRYRDPAQLVAIRSAHPRSNVTDLAPGTFGDLAGRASFSAVAAHYYYYVNLTGTEVPLLLNSAEVTRDYFRLFGVGPRLGRLWDPADPAVGVTPVVVLSHGVWLNQFLGRESIIGEQIMLDEVAHTVIAVMPASFKEPAETVRFWRPMRAGADNPAARDWRYWTVFGRLAPGHTLENANAELAALARQLEDADRANYGGWTLRASGLHDLVVGNHRYGLLLVLGGVGCLMAITAANFTGLALVRSAARSGELAVRHALGASRLQVGRLLVAEALWLALVGGGAGLLVAWWGIGALLRWLPEGWLPRSDEVALSLPVAAVGVALAALAGLAAGLFPAWGAGGQRAGDAMKAVQRSIAGASSRRLRTGLVVAEIAITLILLTGAGLLGRSLLGLMHRDSGVDRGRVLTATISLNAKRY
ncbi:MAG TPA: ABC transporter permease, partial [Lacunisphaera sp.]|nr:ABC transporter permease [Lacunisphaera sp.]